MSSLPFKYTYILHLKGSRVRREEERGREEGLKTWPPHLIVCGGGEAGHMQKKITHDMGGRRQGLSQCRPRIMHTMKAPEAERPLPTTLSTRALCRGRMPGLITCAPRSRMPPRGRQKELGYGSMVSKCGPSSWCSLHGLT